jgi:hypothetical protein
MGGCKLADPEERERGGILAAFIARHFQGPGGRIRQQQSLNNSPSNCRGTACPPPPCPRLPPCLLRRWPPALLFPIK